MLNKAVYKHYINVYKKNKEKYKKVLVFTLIFLYNSKCQIDTEIWKENKNDIQN